MSGLSCEHQLDQLPTAMAVALRLHAAGHGDAVVGTALGVPVEGVPTLLQLARAKFHNLPNPGARSENQWSTTEGVDGPGS
ncbi:hypothetical protein [Ornithinimicrobium cavernae]|uniref:hypothetical protein n=1 Tax=Ornithinimicrobium cavernae TaxID=2666047 RepID=UPI000D6981CD|nr:hypothetical protein [Ornithinimicrobium cavernae]